MLSLDATPIELSSSVAWFSALDADGVYFVARMKDKADYGGVERRPVLDRGPVQRDEIVFLHKLARSHDCDTSWIANFIADKRGPCQGLNVS